jgi:hypothetical protein
MEPTIETGLLNFIEMVGKNDGQSKTLRVGNDTD